MIELLKNHTLIPVCPEQLGWLPTPRHPSEIVDSKSKKVVNKYWEDVSAQFATGALETLRIAQLLNLDGAILKDKSPSCGCGQIYDGSFWGKLVKWDGVTAALLKAHGVKVVTENNIKNLVK